MKNAEDIIIRDACPSDAEELLDIYAPYVLNTAISLECKVPGREEFARRISSIREHFPYLAAEKDGRILGYAYAGRFHEREALQWAAEASIYLRPEAQGIGLGRRLYEELEGRLRRQGIVHLAVLVVSPDRDDEYLTGNSAAFHRHMGFEVFGEFKHCGCKFGRWYNMLWMSKQIGSFKSPQPPVKDADKI